MPRTRTAAARWPIHAADPEAYAGLDAGKLNRVNLARRTVLKPWQEYTMNDRVQWCVAAVPAPGWAAKVFPGMRWTRRWKKLWALIFEVCRVTTGDPVSALKEHVAKNQGPPRPAERLAAGQRPR